MERIILDSGIEIIALAIPPLMTNCYIVKFGVDAVVIDPAGQSEKIFAFIESEKIKTVHAALITHGHFDHVGAVLQFQERQIPVYMKSLDLPVLKKSFGFHGARAVEFTPDYDFFDNQILTFNKLRLTVLLTPGHSLGGVSFYLGGAVFTGDTLFYQGIGRWDFLGGNHKTLLNSINTKLYSLPKETRVLPGHGDFSTIGYEIKHNPYTQDA